jgi:hypothetical protein
MELLKQKSRKLIIQNNATNAIVHWMNFGVEIDDDPKEFEELNVNDLKVIVLLYKVLIQNPISEEMIFYRGFSAESSMKLKQGLEVKSSIITSITTSKNVAKTFGVAWKVVLPKGTPCLYISLLSSIENWPITIDSEDEALLGKGYFKMISKFTFQNETRIAGQFTVQFYFEE